MGRLANDVVARSTITISDGSHYEKRIDAKGREGEPVCIDDEIPFEIPESWIWCRFSSIASFLNGDRSKNYPNRNEYVDDGVAWINTGHITPEGYLDLTSMHYIDESRYRSLAGGQITSGDLVFCLRGATFGKVARVEPFTEGAVASSLMIIRLITLSIREYVFQYLLSPLAYEELHKYNNGSAQPNLAAKDVENYFIPLPPHAEQQRIIAKLNALMPHIDEYGFLEDAREALDDELPDRLRKSVLQMAVEGKLVPQNPSDEPASVLLERIREERRKLVAAGKAKAPKGGESVIYRSSDGGYYEKRGKGEPVCIDDEIPFEIPESWMWARMSSLCNFGKCMNIEYGGVEAGTWNLDLEDLEKESGRIIQKKRKQAHEKGSAKHVFVADMVLYSKLRPYLNKVAIADEDGVCTSEILPLSFRAISSEFAQVVLMSPLFVDYAKSHSYGVKMPRLGTADGANFLLPVPPVDEQKRIVEYVAGYKSFTNQ